MKNKLSTALLALFFGSIGAHRFYLNQDRKGYRYLYLSISIIGLYLVRYFFYKDSRIVLILNYILLVIFFSIIVFDFFYFLIITDNKFDDKYNGYNGNTYFNEIQNEIDTYYQYIKNIDLIAIKKGDFKEGSYNALIKELLDIYNKIINVSPSQIHLYRNDFHKLQDEINKINVSVGDPKINYFNFFNTYLPDDDSF
ncbi:TM2 domain-containing protein [Elizabethkingia miricola]|uniref:NINE protein n=1 Tax=Elizabethkingia miricola TaxID=172045 RepID=UPI00201886CE|nr:TM2 domain-containing protein [Elizabethkingia miricola]MCL1655935.1 TM2 domain-containing protein [Elizabethkingia miricola]